MSDVPSHDLTSKRLLALSENFVRSKDFIACVESLRRGETATFDSVWGSSCALLTSALAQEFKNILVVVADGKTQDDLLDDLPTFFEGILERFPACMPASSAGVHLDLEYGDRLRLIKGLLAGDKSPVIVATVPSLLQPTPSQESIFGNSKRIAVGDQIDIAGFAAWLLEQEFHQTSAVELPGEFSIRGGILDVYAPDWENPVRIELFDDEVESLRQFECANQRSSAELQQIEITVVTQDGPENGCLLDFIPDDTVLLLLEPEALSEQAKRYTERISSSETIHSWEEINRRWAKLPAATASRVTSGHLGSVYQLPIDTVEQFSGDIGDLKLQVDRLARDPSGEEYEIFVMARVEGEIPRVREILSSTAAAAGGRLQIGLGCVHQGFRDRASFQIVIGCDQMFHRTELRRKGRRRLSKAIDSFLDLREGDLIVHLSHGIGRFRGLEMLDKDGQRTEHLALEFHGGTKIYVPATKIDLVQKYIGGSKTRPTLAKIGGKSWAKQKASVESAIEDLASEMIELQAKRDGRPGIAFSPDTEWQSEFEHSFPYRETPDQLTAIEAIKQDMQRAQPMDRLLCGDVGFGKTEVAMRAAFKAVENGYQVGVLVPTTILAEQHYKNFKERMGEFPLDIAKLSRFCSTQELKANVERLQKGGVDIVIGTHRLVSKDVKFFNLGLVIIDEEQRFGVEHKERLKSIRSSVDVLTMSATPIPRTLHMSLVGVRDISNLETPPDDRSAVATKVLRFNNEIIRTGILRELNRGGQVFFVHNRVNDIHLIQQKLESLIPEATFRFGHGQMNETELEEVMTDFIAGKFDVLIATTIIESGLDIPNANTIFINDADRYGLSDLHQLRGRVGRYKHKAYCYLLIEPHKHLNPTAARRLQAIETFSDMGAGFAISMRDLEIRGAGNLLGTQQSGHIATIGYELYCQLLENAVRHLKHMPAKLSIHVEVDLPVAAFLPDSYVVDRRQKIDLYRRLTRLERFDQIEELRNELRDRFGKIPPPVRRLLSLSELKLEAAVYQILSISMEDKYLTFKFQDRSRFSQLSKIRPIIRIIDDQTAMVTLKEGKIHPTKMLALVKSLLQPAT
ncbi:transcription-repair coupling factor [bacterium]|jgi:transcription-repair coupling factor (superfamily II helicase)|nr:transcription-repair coupling factor [bacterium]MDB4368652.1 transcription-repair coupling factor [bacterium]MDB4392045.1 transcription-repair coupling factor [bacterium]